MPPAMPTKRRVLEPLNLAELQLVAGCGVLANEGRGRATTDDRLVGEVTPAPGLPIGLYLAPDPAHHVFADRALEQRPQRPFDPPRVGPGKIG